MSGRICYTVCCTFPSTAAQSVADQWLSWLREEHLQDVLDAGALSAEIVAMDGDAPSFEVRYRFETREAFESYLSDHAPRLRADGLRRFPPELGLSYSRTVGEVRHGVKAE